MNSEQFLNPKFNLTFDDLYEREGLVKLDQKFAEFSNGENDLIQRHFSEVLNNMARYSYFLLEYLPFERVWFPIQYRGYNLNYYLEDCVYSI